MKKLLILMLVLGMTSLASAALQISIGGDLTPPDSEIYLEPSDFLVLDIWSTIPITPQGEGEGQFALVAQVACASISGGGPVIASADWVLGLQDDAVGSGVIGMQPGENGVMGYMYTFGGPIPADVAIFDDIVFHCESLNGPTPIVLYELDASGIVVGIWDTVVVHQIPEPATMLLLGLGGLFLRRRK